MIETPVAAPAAETRSTTLDGDAHVPSGAGAAADDGSDKGEPDPEPEKPKSRLEALEAAAKDVDAEQDKGGVKDKKKPDADAEPPAKGEDDGKDAGKEDPAAKDGKDKPEAGQKAETPADDKGDKAGSEQKYREPPPRFSPRAKEVWGNTPNAVKADVARLVRENEAEIAQSREVRQAWSTVQKYDQMAKQSGTTLDVALERFVSAENTLRENPIKGIANILQMVGISPQQYAQLVLQDPQRYQSEINRQPPPPKPEDPQVAQLKQQMAEMQAGKVHEQIIAPFAASHPRFNELQEDIAFFLQSGKISPNLDPVERLEIAYDMAERINPRSVSPQVNTRTAPEQEEQPQHSQSSAGRKSIKGAPSPGAKSPAVRGKLSRKGAIEAAIARGA